MKIERKSRWVVVLANCLSAIALLGCGSGVGKVPAEAGGTQTLTDASGDEPARNDAPEADGDASGGAGSESGRDGGAPGSDAAVADGTTEAGSVEGGASDGASDAGISFAPCPALGTPCAIMPLGDSITDGFTPLPGGYRIELFHQMLANKQAITFVGRNSNGPNTVDGQVFPKGHEGYVGYTIDNAPIAGRSGISPLVDGAIAAARPNIILLMIGTNDIDLNVDVANAPTRLAALVDRITTDAPMALLAVATIIPTAKTANENAMVQAYDAAIPGLVQQRSAAGKHIILVDNYAAFSANPNYQTALMADTLHPNPAGYALLGQTWYAVIRPFVPVGP
jgi:lysophospholipase L1-like esterase